MMKREGRQDARVPRLDRQNLEGVPDDTALHEVAVRGVEVELSQANLDGDLPVTRRADEDVIPRVADQLQGGGAQLRVVQHEPQKGMGVLQQSHCMYSAK